LEKLNYIEMATLANTSPSNFLRNPTRHEENLMVNGWRFEKIGKGKKAVYHVEEEIYKKPWKEMTFKEKFEDVAGIKCPYPVIMRKYLLFLHQKPDEARFMVDSQLAEKFHCSKYTANKIRNLLIKNGYMEKIKNHKKTDCQLWFYGNKKRNWQRKKLTIQEWKDYWTIFYGIWKWHLVDSLGLCLTIEEAQGIYYTMAQKMDAKKKAFKEFELKCGGRLVKIEPRITTDKFKTLIDELSK